MRRPSRAPKVVGTVNVWDAHTGYEVVTHRGHTGEILDVVFSPDSRRLVSGAADQSIRIWNAASEAGLLNLHGQAVALSPDGRDIATVRTGPDADNKKSDLFVTFSDAASGTSRLAVQCEPPGPAVRMAYDGDGQRLAAVFIQKQLSYSPLVKVWDVATGREEATFPLQGISLNKLVRYGTGESLPVAFSRDGRCLAAVGDATNGSDPASAHGGGLGPDHAPPPIRQYGSRRRHPRPGIQPGRKSPGDRRWTRLGFAHGLFTFPITERASRLVGRK